MGRFRDIERADELKAAKTQLEAWRALPRATKQTQYATSRLGLRTNRGSQAAYIKPFGGAGNFYYLTNVLAAPAGTPTANEENEATLITLVTNAIIAATGTGRAMLTAPTGANVVIKRAKKIQFAKVKVVIPGTAAPRNRPSRMTGISYLQTETKSVSCPFGALTDTETEQEAQSAIRTAIRTANPNARIYFESQGFVG